MSPDELRKSPAPRQSTERERISLLIPIHNEEESVEELHLELTSVLDDLPYESEIVFIDDGSTDGSAEILREIFDRSPRVIVVSLRRRFGKSAAFMAGFDASSGSILITMDADLQDDPASLPGLLAELSRPERTDFVIGWRQGRPRKIAKRLPIIAFNLACRITSGKRLHDYACGFCCFRRIVLDEVALYGELHRYLPVLAIWRGFRIAEHKVPYRRRRHGASRFGGSRYIKALFDFMTVGMLTRFNKSPLYVFGFLGISLTTIGFAVNSYMSILWLTGAGIGTRPLLLFGVLLMIVGLQTTFFGLLAELIVHADNSHNTYAITNVQRRDGQPGSESAGGVGQSTTDSPLGLGQRSQA